MEKVINALNELADEAQSNGNSDEWIASRVDLIKAALEQAPAVEPAQELTAGKVHAYLEQQCEMFGFNPRAVIITLEDEGIRMKHQVEQAQAVPYTAPPAIDEARNPLTDEEICDIALPFVNSYSDGAYGIHEDRVESFARTIELAVIGKIRGSDGQ